MLNTQAYQMLLQNYKQVSQLTLLDLFAEDPDRASKFTLNAEGITVDFSKNNLTSEILDNLIKLAHESQLPQHIADMFSGKKINNTEKRAVLHTALRTIKMDSGLRRNDGNTVIPDLIRDPQLRCNDSSEITAAKIMLDGVDVLQEITHVLQQMQKFVTQVHAGEHLGYSGKKIANIVNIGIGGSDLGPVMVCASLKPYRKNNLHAHFVSSVDGYQIMDILSELDPETTLFVIVSKTFTTEETITNANYARQWFLNKTGKDTSCLKHHFVAVSTNTKAVMEFGIDINNMFGFWDFVGGRYSLWSAVGLTIALYVGFDNFTELLAGAHAMDEHFAHTHDLRQNLPVILALISIWHINFYNYKSEVVLPYNTRLSQLPAYLQQLQMESNGKSVDRDGNPVAYSTCPIIWGGSGINAQHAYFQMLHQGTDINPVDFIVAIADKHTNKTHNDILLANVIAQAEAFMCGKTEGVARQELLDNGAAQLDADFLAKHRSFAGNRPSNMLFLSEISPRNLGALVAMYEHKTFVQGVIWNINSFDQWGVELGKKLAKVVLTDIKSGVVSKHDSSTEGLINTYIFNK